ncbi:MAG: PfkB family carbohydrate kinase [Mariprofundus sp.]
MTDVCCIGHASWDITMAVPHHPEPDEKLQADALNLAGGGPAANAAVCVARLGGSAAFCGYLGLPFTHKSHHSELPCGYLQGALLKQWLFHCKKAQRSR